MYCATTGTFLQRDPIGQPGHPVLGYSHEAVTQIMAAKVPSIRRRSSSSGTNQENNLYAYVGNNPLNSVDPYGLKALLTSLGNTLANTAASQDCKDEAIRIGNAIQNTFTNNRNWFAFPSALSKLNIRVESFQFDACFFDGELPVDGPLFRIGACCPSSDF